MATMRGSWVATIGYPEPAMSTFRQRTYDRSTSAASWNATDGGSLYAPLHSRTLDPAVARSAQSDSVRCRYACSTAPTQGKSARSSRSTARVESVVVWSSMSSVTVVPAPAAASQMARALSRAIFSPSAPSACPTADSFTDTSTRPPWVRSTSFSSRSTVTYASRTARACSGSVVSSPRWSRVVVRPWASSSSLARTASSGSVPGT